MLAVYVDDLALSAPNKQEAAAIQPIGFIAPGMLTPRGDKQP